MLIVGLVKNVELMKYPREIFRKYPSYFFPGSLTIQTIRATFFQFTFFYTCFCTICCKIRTSEKFLHSVDIIIVIYKKNYENEEYLKYYFILVLK